MVESDQQEQAGRLPDFIIVGATKTGTTSLDFYLSLHPEIHMARPKEPRFFIDAPEPAGRWQRGLDWYRSLFASDKALCGEASPTYSNWSTRQGVFERMHSVVPDAKILFVVREHFARLRSSYLMNVRYRGIEDAFADFVEKNQWALDASMYGERMQDLLRFYDRERLLVLEAEELQQRRAETLRSVFEFLGVDTGFHSPLFRHKRHDSRFHMYPNKLGRKILRHPATRILEQKLPSAFFYHLRNGSNWLFPGKMPETRVEPSLNENLSEKFLRDTEVLRELTGLALPTLQKQRAYGL
jgi:hypothetical protein